jgi:hypothetical protein
MIVKSFCFDELNESKIDSHTFTLDQIVQVLEHRHVIVPNRKARRGLYLVIGRDDAGSCISIPIEPTGDPEVWRPVTAWPSKSVENFVLEQRGHRNER